MELGGLRCRNSDTARRGLSGRIRTTGGAGMSGNKRRQDKKNKPEKGRSSKSSQQLNIQRLRLAILGGHQRYLKTSSPSKFTGRVASPTMPQEVTQTSDSTKANIVFKLGVQFWVLWRARLGSAWQGPCWGLLGAGTTKCQLGLRSRTGDLVGALVARSLHARLPATRNGRITNVQKGCASLQISTPID